MIGYNIVPGASIGSIIIGSTATTFKWNEPGKATSTGAASSIVTDHDIYIEVRKAPQYGTNSDSYIKGSTTIYDAYRYRYGTCSST